MKQNTKPGFLDLLSAGDPDTAAAALRLVESGNLKPVQIGLILEAAGTGVAKLDAARPKTETPKPTVKTLMSKSPAEAVRHVMSFVSEAKARAKAAAFKSLTRTIAWKMPAEAVRHFKWELITALNNPDNAHTQRLESLAAGAAVLMEERLLRNDHLLDVAETLAEGLGRTNDYDRITILEERVAAALGMMLPHHHQRIYEAVFELTVRPASSEDCVFKVVLEAYASRAERGSVALEPVVIERMTSMLPQRQAAQAALSYDDKKPNPMARRPAPHAAEIGRRSAANRLNAQ